MDNKCETEQLTYGSETRDNFELEIDPQLYVKDKYYYRNRRLKIAGYIFAGLLLMIGICLLAVYLFVGHNNRSKENNNNKEWKVLEKVDGNYEAVFVNLSSLSPTSDQTSTTSSFSLSSNDQTFSLQSTTTSKSQLLLSRANFIRDMALEAWEAYERYAWGHDVLRPGSQEYSRVRYGLNSGLTIVASMSTLWTMNATEQFERGREWIAQNLNLRRIVQQVSVQSTVTQYIGSLLSTYALTGDKLFKVKANEVAEMLQPAYVNVHNTSTTGLPYGKITPSSGLASDSLSTLSELGGQHLEYVYLAHLTADSEYQNRASRIRNFFAEKIGKPEGLYRKLVYIEGAGEWRTDISTLSKESGAAFYANLLKSYLQSGFKDAQGLEMFTSAMDALDKVGVFGLSYPSKLVFARDYRLNDQFLADYMSSDACYLGGLFALAVQALKTGGRASSKEEIKLMNSRIQRYWTLATNLTNTCHEAARRSPTGLPPARFYFTFQNEATNNQDDSKYKSYHLSPELAESYFVLWRLTGEEKYREWAWEFAQAISSHCRATKNGGGYSGLKDVSDEFSVLRSTNYQNAQFLAATLKYLYLIFDDSENPNQKLFPLGKWVFNEFGQPLPICGTNSKYSSC